MLFRCETVCVPLRAGFDGISVQQQKGLEEDGQVHVQR